MKPVFLAGNQVELLVTGSDYFPALVAAIDAAKSEVHLESYIFADDTTGRTVAAALGRAAARGVATRVIVDGFGAPEFLERLGPGMIAQGVSIMVYRPEAARLRLRRHRLRRLHRKIAVIDRETAFIGGINIVDDIDGPDQTSPRMDYAVAIRGPLLAPIHKATRHLWQLLRWATFRRRLPQPAPAASAEPCGDIEGAFLLRDNLRHRRDIEEAYLDAIADARHEIVLANAYFLPGRRFRRALVDAVGRGVRVTVLLQGRMEYVLQHYATLALYGQLVQAGVRIFEYRKSFLHAKVAVVDGEWATVGSSNIDPFSLLLAREANVVVRNQAFAGRLRSSLERAMAEGNAVEIRTADLEKRSLLTRAASWLAYTAVRIGVGIAGYGDQHDYQA